MKFRGIVEKQNSHKPVNDIKISKGESSLTALNNKFGIYFKK